MTERDVVTPSPVAPPPRRATRWMQRLAEDVALAPTPDEALPEVEVDEQTQSPGTLLLLSALWLAATMWSAYATIAGNALDGPVAVSSAALVLPGICAATLLAGAAAGLFITAWRSRRTGSALGVTRRLLLGGAAGAACGLLAGGLILFGYGVGSSVVIIGSTVAIAGLLGGACAVLPNDPLYGGIAATLAVSVTGVALNLFQAPLKTAFGAGDTVASRVQAADLFSFTHGLVSGLVGGIVAYLFLRHSGLRRWTLYLLAGAIPGLLALLAEGFTQIGGARLLHVVSGFSEVDRAGLAYLANARVTHALIVAFVGGIIATIAFGRTLRRPDDAPVPVDPGPDAATADPEAT
jgi:hypothetical protein